MALLMTPTLWDSVDWLKKCPPSWKKRAYEGLSNTLNRVWSPTKAIERGIAYEKQICHGTKPIVATNITEKFNKAYDMIHAEGHNFQYKAKKFVEIGDREFLLYGKLDVHFPDLVIDIKTTSNYRGKESYLSKWQHKVYTLLTRIPDFMYIVYEFDDHTGLLIDIHFIQYQVNDFVKLEKEVMDKLNSVREFLNSDPKLKKAYLTKFNMYNN